MRSKTVNMHEAKSTLSRLVKELGTGESVEIVIAVANKPAARLVPYEPAGKRVLGIDEGLFAVPDDFDAPDPEIIALFHADT